MSEKVCTTAGVVWPDGRAAAPAPEAVQSWPRGRQAKRRNRRGDSTSSQATGLLQATWPRSSVCNAELCSGVPEKAAGRPPGVGEAGSGRGPIQKEKTLGKEGSVKTGCASSVGAQSPNTAPMQKLRPGREQRKVGPQSSASKVCKNPVQSWGLGNEHPAARRSLLRREVRRWHASWKRGSTFCPLDGACRCGWASQGGVGAALCFLGGRCRRCGLQAPASDPSSG